MTDTKAMSRALGAAFLNHQVEQLEKSAASSANWRARSSHQASNKRRPVQITDNSNSKAANPKTPTKKFQNVNTGPLAIAAAARLSLEDTKEKDAESGVVVIVVDASVLVHALHQLKRWSRDGRKETVIIPLEALNTLDLLKKGTSPVAQRARAASRFLESQVGSNPRIKVQQDDAFVPWDALSFVAKDANAEATDIAPEWVRRTICCARWEVDAYIVDSKQDRKRTNISEVAVAVLSSEGVHVNPVEGAGKHEPRTTGNLVSQWAKLAGIRVLHIEASAPNANPNHGSASTNPASRPRSGTQPSRRGGGTGGANLVERPAAALAMEANAGVVRLLARGERLENAAV
ncbi:unnamed protein product [Mycena citricolor]|uniref:PIN domain-containing protein n=1 Tax=Mycena citricolor TaxID=2018698 RepID=A0AAD2HA20_9AGAR|nr:unnamed protein product [Mycena citricolor]CAK5272976.1 unnamed protein product [Mycena citricolor]